MLSHESGSGSGPARSKLRSRLRHPRNSSECGSLWCAGRRGGSRRLLCGTAQFGFLRVLAALAECHVLSPATSITFPPEKKFSVRLRDVVFASDSQCACCAIDPSRFAFDLRQIADWGVIDHDVAFAVTPLRPKFLIHKR